jgi:hypothetical protein
MQINKVEEGMTIEDLEGVTNREEMITLYGESGIKSRVDLY